MRLKAIFFYFDLTDSGSQTFSTNYIHLENLNFHYLGPPYPEESESCAGGVGGHHCLILFFLFVCFMFCL